MRICRSEDDLPSLTDPLFHQLVAKLSLMEELSDTARSWQDRSCGSSDFTSLYLDYFDEKRQQFLELLPWIGRLQRLQGSVSFSTRINAFMSCIRPYTYALDHVHATDSVPLINACFTEIADYLRQPKHKKQLYREAEKYRDQKKSIRYFLSRLFEVHSRVLVLRLDFGYRSGIYTSLLALAQDRDQLIHYLNSKHSLTGNAMLGWIWRIEYGQQKGYHLHTLIMLDANQVRRDIWYGKQIGDYWQEVITAGDGLAYNCNANKERYKRCGIGKVDHRDDEKRQMLEDAACYLAKPDPRLEIARNLEAVRCRIDRHDDSYQTTLTSRVFGTSQIKESKSRAGRPRDR
jgi:hypothetical protein